MERIRKILTMLLLLAMLVPVIASCGTSETPATTGSAETASGQPSDASPSETAGETSTSEENIPVTGITLDSEALTVNVDETVVLTATLTPENATVNRVYWATDDKSVATVSNGKVTGVAPGVTTITAKSKDGNFTASCVVTVEEKTVLVESIKFDKEQLTMVPGQTEQLCISILPLKAAGALISYYSNNRSIALVSADGVVTAVKEGTTTITAYSENEHYASCTVTVVALPIDVTGVTLSPSSANLSIGQTVTLKPTVLPTDATNKHYTIVSDNPDVATVEGTVVRAVGEGEAVVTVETEDGGYTAKCYVTVSGAAEGIDLLDLSKAQKIRDNNGYEDGIRKKSTGEILFSPSLSELRYNTQFKQKENYEDYVAYLRFSFSEKREGEEGFTFPTIVLQAVKSKGDWVDFFMIGGDFDCGFCPIAGVAYDIEFALVDTQTDPNKAVLYGVYNFTAALDLTKSPYYDPDYGPVRKAGEFVVHYVAGKNGRIEGEEVQYVSPESPSTTVVAIPDEGYKFVQWSDGVKTPERSGDIVNSDTKITASFTADTSNTGVPSMYIYTDSGSPITRKVYEGATMTVVDAPEGLNFEGLTLQIRGRGNSSWDGGANQGVYNSKNSYRIKFDEKISLLGIGAKNKDWVLNSNKFDLSGLRNYLVWTLAEKMETIPYVPKCTWVQLYINDQYRGMYMVTELVETAKGRVDINDNINTDDKGFLLEFDFRGNADDEPYFYMPGYGPDPISRTWDAVEVCIKSKLTTVTDKYGNETYSQEEFNAIELYMLDANEAVFSGKKEEMEKYFDMPSFIDMYIIEELSKDCDVGRASFYISRQPGGKLYCTAPWDFDFGFGTYGPATSYYGLVSDGDEVCPWYGFLVKQQWFRDMVLERMAELDEVIVETLAAVRAKGEEIRSAADANAFFWKMYGNNYHQYVSSKVSGWLENYDEHLDFIEDWTLCRWEEMKNLLSDY